LQAYKPEKHISKMSHRGSGVRGPGVSEGCQKGSRII